MSNLYLVLHLSLLWFTGDSCRTLDIVTTAASISGISPDSAEAGRGQQTYKLGDSSKKHKDKRRERLETVVTQLHTRPRETDNITERCVYDKDKSSDSSSSEEEDEQKEFYLSSESDDDQQNNHVDHGYDSRDGDDIIVHSDHHHRDSGSQRKNIYGGSHSSRSSFRSSLDSISPKYSKRKSTYIDPRSPKRRYSQQSPSRYSDTESDNELPTMVQKGTLAVKSLSAPKRGPKKRGQIKIRDMMRKGVGGFVAPNAHRRGRIRDEDDEGKSKLTPRALEYKNLPFRPQPIQHVMGTAIRYCKEGTIHDKLMLMYYTRGQDVRRAVDIARSQLGMMVNLSISTPYLIEHTMPKNHSKETVRRVSEACSEGIQAVWDLNEEHTHDCVPRCSDYRTVILQAATPCDFLGALKICLQLAQDFPRQVCVRLCSIEGGLNPLPIYDAVVTNYANNQFERKTGSGRSSSYSGRHMDSDLD